MTDYRFIDRLTRNPAAERGALVRGLLDARASIAPKYFYDSVGCALFGAICELPEYYPTRTERAIFVEYRDEIAAAAGRGRQFVDLGAGDCSKAESWLPFLAPTRYVAVDIAGDTLARALARLAPEFPDLELTGIVADFTQGLDLRRDLGDAPATFFYPGSSIGNFAPDDALRFLSDIRQHCLSDAGSGLLIGVDTRKDRRRLQAAYDDAPGVTAAFNRNVLRHVNRVIGTDFDPAGFDHLAFFDERASRIEMHLVARRRQWVRIGDVDRAFDEGEPIHTENSYKYTPAEFTAMLQAAGFSRVRCWQDDASDFAVYYAA
ncbi:MAG TPA: L-histidine N(alpha)-methyltransferase [Casimicrobiaceae bacterium]|nr:L-histidine N(alpha)-methyltransferase [Casimicrobiaceae bacterium]